jgi:hypothetical protein
VRPYGSIPGKLAPGDMVEHDALEDGFRLRRRRARRTRGCDPFANLWAWPQWRCSLTINGICTLATIGHCLETAKTIT